MVGYPQTNRKIDTGKTLTRWPVFVDHFKPTMGCTRAQNEDVDELCKKVTSWMYSHPGERIRYERFKTR